MLGDDPADAFMRLRGEPGPLHVRLATSRQYPQGPPQQTDLPFETPAVRANPQMQAQRQAFAHAEGTFPPLGYQPAGAPACQHRSYPRALPTQFLSRHWRRPSRARYSIVHRLVGVIASS